MDSGCWKVDDDDKGHRQHKFCKKWIQLFSPVYVACKGRTNKKEHVKNLHQSHVKHKTYLSYMHAWWLTKTVTVYIDIEEEEDDGNKIYSKWNELPDLILEQVFSYLTIKQKYYASLVCRSWYRAFYLPFSWSEFILGDSTLTRGRYNYYSGWQYVLDHLRTQMCLTQVGKNFRKLTFEPMLNFYNLYEFMNMLSWYSERAHGTEYEDYVVGGKIKTLKFTFPCNMANNEDSEMIRLFGTGGKLLGALKRLMANLKKLRRLELIDLLLDPKEAQFLLDEVCEKCCLTLHTLILINTTRMQYQLLHVGVFLNLQILKISPQNLGDDLVELLGYTKLKHLHVIQNRYTPNEMLINPVSGKCWKLCRKNNPYLSVHLSLQSTKEKQLVWQEYAPVKSIIYESPRIGIENDALMSAIDLYRKDLRIYGHKCLPRRTRSKLFPQRVDGSLLLLCREMLKLQTLIVTERIATATILLIAKTAFNLKHLYVRRNAVMLKCDWPQCPEWSNDFYHWLKVNSKSYDSVETEVSNILGVTWHMLTDKEFKKLNINLYQ